MRWAGHVAHIGETRKSYILFGKSECNIGLLGYLGDIGVDRIILKRM
jgi:hypothetical protein